MPNTRSSRRNTTCCDVMCIVVSHHIQVFVGGSNTFLAISINLALMLYAVLPHTCSYCYGLSGLNSNQWHVNA